ncbi:MAG: hypothetical protein CMJ84_00045 [Planctomycetes bacterium]|jgi:phage shock protein A|nr:hypothetical protein [Planctomycetota bacterium]
MRDALALVREHAERVDALTEQNAALHEKLEQFSGQVGFLQAQVQERDATIKLLQAPPDEPAPRRRWWSFRGRIWRWGR